MATITPQNLVCKNGALVTIRSAATTDAYGLLELARQLLSDNEGQVRLPGESTRTEEEEQEWIVKHQEHPNWLLLIGESDGAIVGCLDFSSGSYSRLSHRGVFGMGISPSWRSNGIGRGLLGTLIEWATDNANLEKLCLAVIASNTKAIAMYEKMGFHKEGRRVREIKFNDNCYVDDILMHRFV